MGQSAYLLANMVKPGDILVSSDVPIFTISWKHLLIRAFTLSRFTHAGLFVTRTAVLEALAPGANSQLSVGKLLHDASRNKTVIDTGCRYAALLRPTDPALADWSARTGKVAVKFSDVVCGARLAYLGREYPPFADLIAAIASPLNWAFYFGRSLLLVIFPSLISKRPLAKRWFCSSLVATAYADAELPISCVPDMASPGSIRRSKTLREVMGSVIELSPSDLQAYSVIMPETRILGRLSGQVIDQLFERATKIYSLNPTKSIVDRLEAAMDALIKSPAPDLQALLRREEHLVRQNMI